MAIEDAAVLARQLRGKGDLADNLSAFVAERYPRTSAITRASWRFGRIGQWGGRLSCWLRDGLFGLAGAGGRPGGAVELRAVRRWPAPSGRATGNELTGWPAHGPLPCSRRRSWWRRVAEPGGAPVLSRFQCMRLSAPLGAPSARAP